MNTLVMKKRQVVGMEDYFTAPTFYDCILKSSEGHEFKLHKNILAKSSAVFKTLLTSDTSKDSVKLIQLQEQKEVLGELFELIYTGRIERSERIRLVKLALAAKKYLVKDVQDACVEKLISILKVANAVEFLNLSHTSKFENLKEKTLAFIVSNFNAIRNSSSWAALHKQPILMELVFDAYVKEKGVKEKEGSKDIKQYNSTTSTWKEVKRDNSAYVFYASNRHLPISFE